MKFQLYLFAGMLAMASCGNAGTNQNEGKDSTAVDSVAQAPSAPQQEFLSPDLAMQDLYGQVKEMTYVYYSCDSTGKVEDSEIKLMDDMMLYFDFDEKGVLTRINAYKDDKKGDKMMRDDNGRIKRTERYVADYDIVTYAEYTYNDDGSVASIDAQGAEWGGITKYTYTNGVLSHYTSDEDCEGTVFKYDGKYEIVEVDDHGNWTTRRRTAVVEARDYVSKELQSKETEYTLEKRVITYY